MYSIAFDSHKRYTCADVQDDRGRTVEKRRKEHNRGSITGIVDIEVFNYGFPVVLPRGSSLKVILNK